MTEAHPPEPSMEEILASIRRIISEDEASVTGIAAPIAAPPPPPVSPPVEAAAAVAEDDVLILRERAPAEPTPATDGDLAPEFAAPTGHETAPAPAAAMSVPAEEEVIDVAPPSSEPPAAPPAPEPVMSAADTPPAAHEPAAPPAPAAGPAPAPPTRAVATVEETAVVADEIAASAAASFEKLSLMVGSVAPPQPTVVAVSAHGPTLEDLTRELLKPILKAWLDENLADIVRERVDQEVERIARGRVR